jgi:hypothetical protein
MSQGAGRDGKNCREVHRQRASLAAPTQICQSVDSGRDSRRAAAALVHTCQHVTEQAG